MSVFSILNTLSQLLSFPINVYLFNVNNKNARKMCEMFQVNSKDTRTTSMTSFVEFKFLFTLLSRGIQTFWSILFSFSLFIAAVLYLLTNDNIVRGIVWGKFIMDKRKRNRFSIFYLASLNWNERRKRNRKCHEKLKLLASNSLLFDRTSRG